MGNKINISINRMSSNEKNLNILIDFLYHIDTYFPVPLSKKVSIDEYAKKVLDLGIVIYVKYSDKIVGIITGYANDMVKHIGYISVLGVLGQYQNMGIGKILLQTMRNIAYQNRMKSINLYTHKDNFSAIQFYLKQGFEINDSLEKNFDYDIALTLNIESDKNNILITSVGRRNYLVRYFKEALGDSGEVHVSNSTSTTPAFINADQSVVTPLIYDKNYIAFLKSYCINNKIKAIISLFDIDLSMLSANKKLFEDIGIKVIVSNLDIINICNDKLETYKFLKQNGFHAPKTYISLKEALNALELGLINYPVIIKPRWGMGSIGVFEAENQRELNVLYNKTISNIKNSYLKFESQEKLDDSVIIQEKLSGQEYGLDIINDLSGEYQNTIVKVKYAMRSGETDCAKTIFNNNLKMLGESISKKLHHIGNLDVDVFMEEKTPYILEMNARFGGGYPFSHIAGVNLPKAIIHWLKGEEIPVSLLKEEIGVLSHKDIEIVNITAQK